MHTVIPTLAAGTTCCHLQRTADGHRRTVPAALIQGPAGPQKAEVFQDAARTTARLRS